MPRLRYWSENNFRILAHCSHAVEQMHSNLILTSNALSFLFSKARIPWLIEIPPWERLGNFFLLRVALLYASCPVSLHF